jgi:hypothetical protein
MFRSVAAVSSPRLALGQRAAVAAIVPVSCGPSSSVGDQRRMMSTAKIDRFHTQLGRTGLLALKCGMVSESSSCLCSAVRVHCVFHDFAADTFTAAAFVREKAIQLRGQCSFALLCYACVRV